MGVASSRIIGGRGKADRALNDYYPTPQGTTRAVLPLLRWIMPKKVWEPCCGEGHMSCELIAAGFDVVSTDLVDRGYGWQADLLGVVDPPATAVVTNPPFALLDDILFHLLAVLDIRDIALVLPMQTWNARARVPVFRAFTPSLVMPMTWRIDTSGEGRPTMSFMWCIWSQALKPIARFMPIVSGEAKPGTYDDILG